ncbi:MAG: DNA repair protein RadC [Halorhodospira halophila]|uniref:RadC family protein n=1 Tax=Halorhodospira TaxID=85108 RepID=UPI00191219D7|nr:MULTISPECIES: DNA repair protein RadC [Halorhodospira]MBK5944611.1 hypothetical protein [Halorhodospira halophila]MCC3750748.1 DNA repair protein RadC [Halorhodospira halophila]MCG5527246.1 DNA repair protein RadC [Halorhodospira halophila]MCG5532527.1 DNA repair protein RadC [Halorhodospira sp. 9621]MCG5538114.1 DNA repair protein RadC [Halorhodospira sp. 9622]
MSIRSWPRDERPRERLIQRGPQALSDAELLAIFLRTGRRGQSAVELARELLAAFSGLRGLLEADRETFAARPGLGDAKYAQMQAALEIARRHLGQALQRGPTLSSPAQTRTYLTALLRDHPSEVFGGLFLDNRHRVIGYEELFRGTIDGASVYPRELVRRALAHNAAAVIVAHNHPSGVAEPSAADEALTHRLREALGLVDVRLLDHFVVGDGEPVSLAERGVL